MEVENPAVLSSSVTADPSVESPFSACSCSGGGGTQEKEKLTKVKVVMAEKEKKDRGCMLWLEGHRAKNDRLGKPSL